MLQDKENFGEDDIIDEVLDLMVAGTQTTQHTTQYALFHFMTDKDSLERTRAECEQLEGSSIEEKLTLENLSELTYLGYVIQECLRLNSPATGTSMYSFDRDTQLGPKLRVRAKDQIIVNMVGLHINSTQWQRPLEFLPDRFDMSHPLSKKPDGGRRSTYAWAPFNGGKRICFGKTFAEAMMKISISMISQLFDFKFVDEEKYNRGNLPMR